MYYPSHIKQAILSRRYYTIIVLINYNNSPITIHIGIYQSNSGSTIRRKHIYVFFSGLDVHCTRCAN